MSVERLYLASASPRRMELLRQLGLNPVAVPQDVDEREIPGEEPGTLVVRLAGDKARSAARDLDGVSPPGLIIGADTAVVVDGAVLGKPRDADHAVEMLRRLRGREHQVLTGVHLRRTDTSDAVVGVETTHVLFREYDDRTLSDYVACGEPLDKAGAYGIQGRGALLSAGIRGSWSNVVGFPLERLPGWLASVGVELAVLRG